MKNHSTLLSVALAATMGLTFAGAANADGYGMSSGSIAKNSYGQCWTTGSNKGGDVDANGCPVRDSDGDGVLNNADRCPGTAAGIKVDAHGCAGDDDKDGVINEADKCPSTGYGIAVDGKGCAIDKDGDGVAWSVDACKGTPAGTPVDASGCAMLTLNILFDTNSAAINASAHDAVMGAVDALKHAANISVEGFTDSTGDAAYNQALSERRANAIMKAMMDNGITAKMSAVGHGEAMPVADNGTAEGRAANRRVEIHTK